LRAAQIGYILAHLENYPNLEKISAMLVFHEMAESRTGDINRVEGRYLEKKKEQAAQEQTKPLGKIGEEILALWQEAEDDKSAAGQIAKDADMLEHSLTAKEYIEKGYKHAQNWIDNTEKGLKTEAAKKLIKQLQQTDSNSWWQGLKKVPRSDID
jgi:putative hydrolase of HD superfamily